MNHTLPEKPNLDQLRRQAKDLEKAYSAGDAAARERVLAHLPDSTALPHHASLFVVAREYGFASWARMKRRVDELNRDALSMDDFARLFVEAATSRRVSEAAAMRKERPEVAEHDLACACLCGNQPLVADRLARKPELINQKVGHKQWEPLLYACYSALLHPRSPHREQVKRTALWLIEQGANPNAFWRDEVYKEDESCLYGATGVNNCPELAEALLQAGADVNDNESLYHSTELPDTQCLEILIRHGVRPERTNSVGRAIDMHSAEKVRILLEHGADPNEGLNQTVPILRHALMRGAPLDVFSVLIEFGIRDWTSFGQSSAFALAHWLDRQDVVKLMQESGLGKELTGGAAYLAAVSRGEPAEPAPLPMDWSEAPIRAAELGNLSLLRRIIAAGLDPHVLGPTGDTGLHWACWAGQAEVVELLLQSDPPIHHIETKNNSTPMGWACYGSSFARTHDGEYHNPKANYPAIGQMLIEAGSEVSEEMMDTASDEMAEAILVAARLRRASL